jgi:hypothetical protein
MMPICPIQKEFVATPTPCKFHYETTVTPALSYKARQCRARKWEIMKPDRDVHMMTYDNRLAWILPDLFFTSNNDQYVGPLNVGPGVLLASLNAPGANATNKSRNKTRYNSAECSRKHAVVPTVILSGLNGAHAAQHTTEPLAAWANEIELVFVMTPTESKSPELT